MKVRLTEQKLRSLIKETLKERYDSLGQNIDTDLFDKEFINATQRYAEVVQEAYDSIEVDEDGALMIKMICTE